VRWVRCCGARAARSMSSTPMRLAEQLGAWEGAAEPAEFAAGRRVGGPAEVLAGSGEAPKQCAKGATALARERGFGGSALRSLA
jgi:hypothetical protein